MRGIKALAVGLSLMFVAIVIFIIPTPVTASITDADAISSAQVNYFSVQVKWTFTAQECIEPRLFANGVLVETGWEDCASSGEGSDWLSHSPIEAGTYKIQLWSTDFSVERWSKTWTLPGIALTLEVSPISGEVGTSFIATTRISLTSTGPDAYATVGSLEIVADGQSARLNVYNQIISDHYLAFQDSQVTHDLSYLTASETFSFDDAGTHSFNATYKDVIASLTAGPLTASVTNQYQKIEDEVEAHKSDTIFLYVALFIAIVAIVVSLLSFFRKARIPPEMMRPSQTTQAPSPPLPPQQPYYQPPEQQPPQYPSQ